MARAAEALTLSSPAQARARVGEGRLNDGVVDRTSRSGAKQFLVFHIQGYAPVSLSLGMREPGGSANYFQRIRQRRPGGGGGNGWATSPRISSTPTRPATGPTAPRHSQNAARAYCQLSGFSP